MSKNLNNKKLQINGALSLYSTNQVEGYLQKVKKSKQWLKLKLEDIQNHVAEQASDIIQKSRAKTIKTQECFKYQQKDKSRSLQKLKIEENEIRQKLREISILKRTTKNLKKKKYDSYKREAKSNSQLKQLIGKYRQFKQNLIKKSRNIEQKQQNEKHQILKLKEEHLKTQCEIRRKNIELALKNIQQRRARRQQNFIIEKNKLKQLTREKLYQKILRNFNKKSNQENQRKICRYRNQKKQMQIDISTLSQHEKNYFSHKNDRQERRTLRMAQSRILPEINYYKSRFFDSVLEQQAKRKQLEKAKKERGKMIAQKHKQYQQKVDEQYKPTPKQNESDSEKQNKITALEWEQIKKKGNQYYKMGQLKAIPADKREQHMKMKQQQQKLNSKIFTYPNYLSEVLKKVTQNKKQQNEYDSALRKLQKLLKNKNIGKGEKIEQVRMFVQRMSFSFVPNKQYSQQQLINRLNIKMELLQMLNDN